MSIIGKVSFEGNAFYGCSGLTEVTIPDGVNTIGARAFCKCTNLRKVTLGEDVTSIGAEAFVDLKNLAEINLPAKQNGSSIMPGKINPVIPEVINQIAFNVIGNDMTITMATEAGQLELNAFEPVIFHCLFEQLETLTNGIDVFRKDCIEGITVNTDACEDEVERSIGIVTALCPYIGYTKAASIAKRALKEKRNVRDVLIEENVVAKEDIRKILDPYKMI